MTSKTASLPKVDDLSLAHSEKVKAHIERKIRSRGTKSLNFAEFMHEALYAPGLGYYVAGNQKLGPEGDFVTAPEISPLFSQCLANQLSEVLVLIPDAVIIEFGAGSGQMALGIMQSLAKQGLLPDYYIVEVSPELKQRQKQLIQAQAPELLNRFTWLGELPTNPLNAIILANEVLDAMPCHRFSYTNDTFYELYVGLNETNELAWQLGPLSSCELKATLTALSIPNEAHYTSEINLLHGAWIHSLSKILAKGLILLIDYGYPEAEYYHRLRNCGTLKCFFRHHQHEDPLILTGIQDITSHVNFTNIARKAIEANLDVTGFISQGAFLINCGIEHTLNTIEDERDYVNAAQQIKKLTLPTQMGELFKVMALSRKIDTPLLGFTLMDRLKDL